MLVTSAFSKDISRLPFHEYELKKLDGVIYIDTRMCKRDEIHLIEVDRPDLLIPRLGRIRLNSDGFSVSAKGELPTYFYIFATINPWFEVEVFV